jgi:hypothetical protein
MPINSHVEEAIPHEAGHIVVGLSFQWIPIRELAVSLYAEESGIRAGDFATASIEPPNEAIASIPPERLTEYKLFIAGGLAGNRFAGLPAVESGMESDRKQLARVGTESLETMADMAMSIIHKQRRIFRRIVSVASERYGNLIADSSAQPGRHTLLNQQELIDLFNRR